MAGDATPLFGRSGGERWEPDHVASGIDVRNLGPKVRIDRQAAAFVGLDSSALERDLIGVRNAPRGKQDQVGAHALATFEMNLDVLGVDCLDRFDCLPKPQGHAAVAQMVREFTDNLAIEKAQNILAPIDQGHVHVECAQD